MIYFSTLLGLSEIYGPLELFIWSMTGLIPAVMIIVLGSDRWRIKPFCNNHLGPFWHVCFISGIAALLPGFIWLLIDQPFIIIGAAAVCIFVAIYYPLKERRQII
jgi:hypothetical protein